MKLPGRVRVYNCPRQWAGLAATEDAMVTASSYTMNGSPQLCAYCRRPFPVVEERREAFHCRKSSAYFCDSGCARQYREAMPAHRELVSAHAGGRRAA
jgi:hypothetical protein